MIIFAYIKFIFTGIAYCLCFCILSKNNYILTFETEAKEVQIGGVDDNLSSKILYMDYLLNEQEGIPGTIYLNQERVYFSPK